MYMLTAYPRHAPSCLRGLVCNIIRFINQLQLVKSVEIQSWLINIEKIILKTALGKATEYTNEIQGSLFTG